MHLQFFSSPAIEAVVASERDVYRHAAANAVAQALALPAMAVESPSVHFEQNHAALAAKVMGVFNEVRSFSFEDCTALVKEYWLARYAVVHYVATDSIIVGGLGEPSALDVFGVSEAMSRNSVKFIDEHHAAIMKSLGYCIGAARKAVAHYVATAA